MFHIILKPYKQTKDTIVSFYQRRVGRYQHLPHVCEKCIDVSSRFKNTASGKFPLSSSRVWLFWLFHRCEFVTPTLGFFIVVSLWRQRLSFIVAHRYVDELKQEINGTYEINKDLWGHFKNNYVVMCFGQDKCVFQLCFSLFTHLDSPYFSDWYFD